MNKEEAAKQTLNLDEIKELLRLAFNKGLQTGKQIKPINEIPMGSSIVRPAVIFENFFKETILNLNKEKHG